MTQNQNGSICAEEYVVKRGDSFYLIAHKLGVPLRDLLAANRDIHPARLMVGDVLCIPREEDDKPQGGTPGGDNGTAGGSTGTNGTGSTGNNNAGNNAGTDSDYTGNNAGTGSGNVGNTNTGNSSAPSIGEGSGTPGNSGNVDADPPTPAPAPGLSCPIEEHLTLAQGQTIADIQLQSLLSRNTLQTANPTVDLDTLQAGQTICVPTENIACVLPPTYTLLAGETLESVAMRFNLPLGSLLRVNPCLAPQDFEEGVTVILPR